MILPWRWREVYAAYTLKDKEAVFAALDAAKIEYDYKIDGSFDPGRVRGGFSGMISHHSAELRVFVRPKDYETALYLVRKAVRENAAD